MASTIDATVRRYSTLRIVATLTDSADAPIDLTGATGLQGWLAPSFGSEVSEATVSLSDAAAGELTVLFSDGVIGALTPGRYPWEGWLQLPTSGDRVCVAGTITVEGAIKQPSWS